MAPETKYEEDGGPSLLRIAGILRNVGAPDSLERLLKAVTVNALIGNGDAHAKNFSLLHRRWCADADTPVRPHVHAVLRRRSVGDVHRQRPSNESSDDGANRE
ncbi:MAG: hypothetical protein HKL87_02210 [Acidimicrobiaceae bacterium]|nr:hypothetical protein [Acidimicrobiaceae bacterium]